MNFILLTEKFIHLLSNLLLQTSQITLLKATVSANGNNVPNLAVVAILERTAVFDSVGKAFCQIAFVHFSLSLSESE